MRPKRFVEAVKGLKFREVLNEEDFGRVQSLYVEAIDNSADRVLVGFQVRDPAVRIVWARVKVIPVGLLEEEEVVASALPPSEERYEAWDFRLDGLTFVEGPTGELSDLDEAKPDGLENSPAVLFSYPGRGSWEKLRQVFEQSL
jgi:hypothetical protein